VGKNKKILITGSSGMLSCALCQKFRQDYELFGLDIISAPDLRIPEDKFLKVDITERKNVLSNISRINPDAIIHTASYTDVDASEACPEKAYKINSLGTENLALAAKETGAFLIYLSTDYIFDGSKKTAYTEEDHPCPINIYGDSKLKGEERIRNSLKRYLIIRTSWLFGPKGNNFVDTILKIAKTKDKLAVVNDQVGSPTYTFDLASAMQKMLAPVLDNQAHGLPHAVYNITNSNSCSWHEFAQRILALKNITGVKIEALTSGQLKRQASRPKMSVLDNGRYRAFIGSALRPWQEALGEYLS